MSGFLVLLALLFSSNANQNEKVLMTIGSEKVTVSEFQNIFQKNNDLENINKEELENYVDLFVKFKMKVLDAESISLDTSRKFINELKGYRKQLSRPYLTDKQAENKLLSEAYERTLKEVKVSHILILLDENALPKDTLSIFNKINLIRNKALNGESFDLLAKTYSEDPSAKINSGNLGYFSAFRMVYPFENAAYNTNVGEVSKPFRTRFGYHILKVTDKRESRGQVKVAHIMIEQKENANTKEIETATEKVNQLMDFFNQGKTFDELVQFSDDNGTKNKGGELPWFGTGQMVPEFENAAFNLKVGEISKPIKTNYGWHILKLIDKKNIEDFDAIKSELERKIKRDTRSNKGRKSLINRIKKENNFKEYKNNLEVFYQMNFDEISDFKLSSNFKVLFSLKNKKYFQSDFFSYLKKNKTPVDQSKIVSVINKMYFDWIEKECINLEDKNLESKYPEFKSLMQEYRDGILLFDLMDQKVWSKAVKDTVGLKNYFDLTKDKYKWDERIEASIFTCIDISVAERVKKLLSENSISSLSNEELSLLDLGKGEYRLNEDDVEKIINNSNPLNLKVENGKFIKGENSHIDKNNISKGFTDFEFKENKIVVFALIHNILKPTYKDFNEAKGQLIANYQDYLEAVWINELEKKYPVKINDKLLRDIFIEK